MKKSLFFGSHNKSIASNESHCLLRAWQIAIEQRANT